MAWHDDDGESAESVEALHEQAGFAAAAAPPTFLSLPHTAKVFGDWHPFAQVHVPVTLMPPQVQVQVQAGAGAGG
ncbi:uncharacterized protein SETTUDRAFT_165317 [Exserohilum turcica Et28A]|uniref:Uncharacterized protein n=1 Tax=Exserohilum turcicum (strain 28A) TaxID=671987 RepID=R0JZT9_EXST2|nr:uncharacterized protein SETTUDRAFT_165317 [Exserohilum turcica Et28A]EOA82969.1 hypothetical protein SETTUDRAFT_165317 [Exserohilum turcica Et28A]